MEEASGRELRPPRREPLWLRLVILPAPPSFRRASPLTTVQRVSKALASAIERYDAALPPLALRIGAE